MKNLKLVSLVALATNLTFIACIKDKTKPVTDEAVTTSPAYNVPTTYEFGSNTNLTSSNQRIAMLKELVTYIRSTHTATTNIVIDATKMRNMYSNLSNPFTDAGLLNLNSSGINLKEKTNTTYNLQTELDALFAEAASVSQGTASGLDGQAGKVLGPAPTTTAGTQAAYLMNAKGFEYKEVLEKGAMGAILYSEATTLLKNIGTFDNTSVIEGKGTAMEHAWDEAFGYFAVPVSFPTVTIGVSYWGSYCNSVNAATGLNATIMNAWLKGRAAISNKDNSGRDEARNQVMVAWEKVGAAKSINYLKQAKTNFANNGLRNHVLSEGVGLIKAFRYNPSKTISDADINTLLGYIGDNFYQVSLTNMDAAISKLATVFNLDASKL
jgi:hypothetical protein